MYYPPNMGYPGFNPWCPPPTPYATPPQATGDPIKDLKKAIKFYTKLEKKQKEKSKEGSPPKKVAWKDRVDMYILLAISTPILIPLYSIMVHRLWELAK